MRSVIALALASAGRSSLVLLAFAPVLWLAIDAGLGYHASSVAAWLAYAVAGLAALGVLVRGIGAGRGRWLTAVAFMAVFFAVGGQAAWILRPYLGRPSEKEVPPCAPARGASPTRLSRASAPRSPTRTICARTPGCARGRDPGAMAWLRSMIRQRTARPRREGPAGGRRDPAGDPVGGRRDPAGDPVGGRRRPGRHRQGRRARRPGEGGAMSLRDLVVLYLIAGPACAVAVYRVSSEGRRRAALSAALCVPLWPIWAPVALTAGRGEGGGRVVGAAGEAAARVQGALREGSAPAPAPRSRRSCRATRPRGSRPRCARAAARHAELDALLRQSGFDEGAAAARARGDPERGGAGGGRWRRRTCTSRTSGACGPCATATPAPSRSSRDLVQALRAQLVLARFAGSSVEGVGGIVSEVWARVEGLGAAIDAHGGAGTEGPIAT